MNDFDVIGRIKELCRSRSWSYYRLAKESGIPYSTLNTMLHKTYVPTVPSLMKICDGFGITIAQFFTEEDETARLTADQRQCLDVWNKLNDAGKELATVYMQGMVDHQEAMKTKSAK